jgi:putative endonuclease
MPSVADTAAEQPRSAPCHPPPEQSHDRPHPRSGTDRRRAVGALGERLALEHLRRLDYEILARNVRTRHGEIDVVACGGGVLVFAEVKTRSMRSHARSTAGWPNPLERLGAAQRARLRRLASAWLTDGAPRRPAAGTIRFDAVGVIVDERGRLLRLDHVEGAW